MLSFLLFALLLLAADARTLSVPGKSLRTSTKFSPWSREKLQSRAATLPAGWAIYIASGNDGGGCYADGSVRLLSTFLGRGFSLVSCLEACSAKSMVWAGVEYGGECYCSATTPTSFPNRPSAACSMNCPGSTDKCGAAYRMNMYKYTAQAPSLNGYTLRACISDGWARALTGYSTTWSKMTVAACTSACAARGFALAGLENGNQCFCDNSIKNGLGAVLDSSRCSNTCGGGGLNCGGTWAISLWSSKSLDNATSSTSNAVSASSSSSRPITSTSAISSVRTSSLATATVSSSSSTSSPSPSPSSTGLGYRPNNYVPPSTALKYIWAYVVIANTSPYTYDRWMTDIRLAAANGIDGFVLNISPGDWQPARVSDAYRAAQNSGTSFKMMLSFDMAEFTCDDTQNVALLQSYLNTYVNHSAAAKIENKSGVTTLGGSGCYFGQASSNAGWSAVFGELKNQIYFMPAYAVDAQRLGSFDIAANVNWESAWPSDGEDIDTNRDEWHMRNLSPTGKKYVGTISPGFFTHSYYRNWLLRSDNWLYAQRWEQLISMRGSIDQIQIISWNDYSESTYIDLIAGDVPFEATQYVNDAFSHQDVLSLNAFYAQAWKNGTYPLITQDKVWVAARPHPVWATATGDAFGPPNQREYTQDNFAAQVHLVAPASVILCSGENCTSFSGSAGINRFSHALIAGQGISVQVTRNGQTTVNLRPSFTFQGNPATYNYNFFIQASTGAR